MSIIVTQKNFLTSREREKKLNIEMNETPRDITMVKDLPYHASEVLQPQHISYIQSQVEGINHLQGSALSLASRSYIDQSDVQPLTIPHPCRYDECSKIHHAKSERESQEGPSSPVKNFFLYLVIVLLLLWIAVYTTLTHLKVV